jgi:hypothetical protein
MSVEPLTAAVTANADLAALIDAELAALAADAQALRALLVEGAVVTARVMPSNGLTDLLEIAGRRVAASLPPTVRPGEAVQVQVTGFDGDRILLRIVGTGADAAVEPGPPNLALVPDAAIAPLPPSATVPEAPAPVASAPPAAPPTPPGQGAAAFAAVQSRASVVPAQAVPNAAVELPAQTVIATPEPTSIEARIAATRAAVAPPAAPAPARTVVPAAEVPAGPRFVAPPQFAPKSSPAQPVPAATVMAPAARSTGLSAYAEPVALLRALKLPVTPGNVASAALALQRPDRLPAALAALERALPRADDPHVATLRALLGFVGRIDPRSPVLATQIAAYVEHVVDGNEPKLATLLAATRAAAQPEAAPSGAAPPATAAPAASDPHRPTLAAALAAERHAALGADLKQTLLAVAADPATPESLAPSLANALTALTAVQLNAAQALAAQPDGIAFTIPLTTAHGTSSAHISVKRDAPGAPGARLDGENFRIAFVLETAHYGTVAIDLVTVGREVTVDVRTESAAAMRSFRDALGALTTRLEALRYRVASAGASVGPTSTVSVEAAPSSPVDPNAVLDRSA